MKYTEEHSWAELAYEEGMYRSDNSPDELEDEEGEFVESVDDPIQLGDFTELYIH